MCVISVAEYFKMVGRLHVVLLSIVPTGAALVYLLWMFGWKKTKSSRGHHCQKTQVIGVTIEESHNNVDITLPSSSEQLLSSLNNEEDCAAENDVSSVLSASDDVSISHGSCYTDVKSPCGDEAVSANTVACEQSIESAVDVRSTSLDHCIDDKAYECHCENVNVDDVSVGDRADDIANEVEILKCPVIDSHENNTAALLGDDSCCNSCIVNGNVDGNEAASDSGCIVNGVSIERCENGRRDSIGSVRLFLLL